VRVQSLSYKEVIKEVIGSYKEVIKEVIGSYKEVNSLRERS
jgi:hypothetical protein